MKKLTLNELNRPNLVDYQDIEKLSMVVILDNIRSGHNVGAVFRTSDALLVEEVVLCGITPCPPHREILKTAIGATQSVNWTYYEDTTQAIEHYKSQGYTILGIEQTSESVMLAQYHIDPSQKYVLILGNEVDGISDEVLPLLDDAIEIPQYGTKHSFNISVCAGIILWEWHNALIK